MPSPNLAVTHVAAAQNQKEVTINDAVDALDNAMNRALSLAMADANVTLTSAQANRNGMIVLTGTLTAARVLTLPANHRRLAIRNATSGGQEVRAKYAGSGAEVIIVPGATVLVQGNGSDLFGVGGGAGTLNDLTDVSAGGAVASDVLQFDGAVWSAGGVGIFQRALLPFRGALVQRSTDIATVSPPILIPWQASVYDSEGFWAGGTPERLTIPAGSGITKVRLLGSIAMKASATTGGVYLTFDKNGAGEPIGAAPYTVRQGSSGYTNNDFSTFSAVLPVVEGDYFQLRVNFTNNNWNSILAGARTWFAIEVVETQDAADPPADLTGFKMGQPSADEILMRVPIARRTRMKVDLAGSQGVAGAAATAQTDFDIRRNGTSFATMRFAAAGTVADFIAATETVLEPGDVLSVVAPAAPDTTLADIGFTLAGMLVV
ncbi:hypothetical protein E5163_05900 [Marinicauda algicola]|jgi:hypothetical protein|uniref:Uncharacterized protein n=1 Tax=Marinicauda algicola TaxID=2029849 RepID=A0A4S2H4Q1_9PROT|nr:hypothetical protein [Marinicauda algicola]TGY90645.1 hypothetical protein E5163_05900 [Marinicauda algicola]